MITLLHPSKGRPEMAYKTYLLWKERAADKDFEYILGIDQTDKTQDKYKEIYQNEGGHVKAFLTNSTDVVSCTNKLAKISKGDILVYLSDDFECPENWDQEILKRVEGVDKFLLKVDDNCQPFDQTVLTIPIMSRSLYTELGYFWFPEYKSMFCDVDLYYATMKHHIYAPELMFNHKHWTKHNRIDSTYQSSESNWEQGERIFNRRKAENKW